MRSERWWQDASVVAAIFEQATAFEFIQATRLLRHAPYQLDTQHWADAFQFGTSLSLSFPASEVEALTLQDEQIQIRNLLVGLTGTQGALPYTYTHKIRQSPRQQRQETQAFLDLFNHSLTAQYVDASLAYNLPVRYEIEQKNDYLDILHALNGYVRDQHQQSELDEYFAEFAGLMQGQNNTAHALRTVLNCVFKQPIEIKEFITERFYLSDEQRSCLGGLQPTQLGVNSFCGESIRQMDGKIEIQIGPMKHQHYLEFLPEQPLSQKLKHLLQTWCSPTLLVDVRLILDVADIQPLQLATVTSLGLGQGAFLLSQPATVDNDETCYALVGAAA
ncbi:type VI secretion system baseplate subunit TssG [Acinetobacter sp. MB5]|uniref:type VI secretion system baseplate subunit TssG n=1 Tax=Acinetobacter sp. MB5 TaxID=2069438 RepID=UPI000DCF738A|nr:type VI secretion system baseplate subunit TssG [Acinetobacter sp. MB5]